MDDHIFSLVKEGKVHYEEALFHSFDRKQFEAACRKAGLIPRGNQPAQTHRINQ